MGRAEPKVLVAFATIVVLLGMNFIGVRLSNRELSPFWGASFRFIIASAVLFAVVFARGLVLPRGRALVGAALYGFLSFGVIYALLYWALIEVRASLASVIFSTVPLLTLVIATAIGQERFHTRGLLGGLAALAGTAVVFTVELGLDVSPLALTAVVVAALAAAVSGIVVRGFPRSHPVSTNAVGMGVGTVLLLAVMAAAGERPALPALSTTWLALAYLVVSSIISFVLMVWLLQRWTASAVAYVTVLFPLVTVAAGSLVSGEGVTLPFLLGGALILLGVYAGAVAPAPAPAPAR